MGGDLAPRAVVEGALHAARELEVEIVLVGQKEEVEKELGRFPERPPFVEVLHAPEVVAMDESPSIALKKEDSSMKAAFSLMKRGEVRAVVGAGNSGAMMAIGMLTMGRLPGVDRPAILVVVPTPGRETVIIDAGANVDCKPHHLVQFAVMGAIYAERVLGIHRPRVGVLSNGEEECKGNDLTRAANKLIAATPLHHIGYVEGRDIFRETVDVVVCDGFTGNVTLKTIEGIASFFGVVMKDAFQQTLLSRLGFLLSRGPLRQAYGRFDHAEHGGAPLLGLEGVAIIAHGGSDARAIKNAIRVAKETVAQEVNRRIIEGLKELGVTEMKEEKFPRRLWRQIKTKIEHLGEKPTPAEEEAEDKNGGKD